MKKKRYCICLILCLTILSGCEKKEPVSEKKQEQVVSTQQVTEEITEEITEEMTTETTTQYTTEQTVEEQKTEEEQNRKNILISIDPGHQGPNVDMSATEPNAPGSSEMKRKATSGTAGRFTGVGEYQLNLDISLKLRDALQAEGYDVILTRENNDTAISNAERATLANEAGADISIRIHANGSDDSGTNGALVLIGSESNPYVGSLYDESYDLGKSVLDSYCASTGMANLGIQENDTMTGINWSQIPVIILEMGFMTNEQDDRNMQDEAYQQNMVQGIVDGVNAYYGY